MIVCFKVNVNTDWCFEHLVRRARILCRYPGGVHNVQRFCSTPTLLILAEHGGAGEKGGGVIGAPLMPRPFSHDDNLLSRKG